jgi:hypothetical protein
MNSQTSVQLDDAHLPLFCTFHAFLNEVKVFLVAETLQCSVTLYQFQVNFLLDILPSTAPNESGDCPTAATLEALFAAEASPG